MWAHTISGPGRTMVTLVVIAFSQAYPAPTLAQGWDAKDADVRVLMDDLWTERRAAAKEGLRRIGPRAAPCLILLIDDLVEWHETAHFVMGRNGEDPVLITSRHRYEATWGVIRDCVELLRPMRLPEAAPALVRVLETRSPRSWEPKPGPEMMALVEIGPAAMPPLVGALEHLSEVGKPRGSVGPLVIRLRSEYVLAQLVDKTTLPELEGLIGRGVIWKDGRVANAVAKARLEMRQ
jgi:hypothetical protein